jgi:hypothetical protein
MNLEQIRVQLGAAVDDVRQAMAVVAQARGAVAEASGQLQAASVGTSSIQRVEALQLWNEAHLEADQALDRGIGHAESYLGTL